MTQGKIYKPTCSTHKTLSSKTHNLLPLPSHAYSAIPHPPLPPFCPLVFGSGMEHSRHKHFSVSVKTNENMARGHVEMTLSVVSKFMG